MAASSAVLTELKGIRKDISYIKKHIVHADLLLTDDDVQALREADRDWKEGKTKRLV
ncbi:MAG: hypothetical protein HY520_00225 [Candidatus Aenigmarchaeota archaeon]|nr:hypothetical protein [Candidatus Aenigmarchaeota archaeon]